jgi:two-component system response regulator NreC
MQKVRILIAEENASVRENVRAILAREDGIEVTGEAGSLPEMMARVNQSRPDILLLNVTMGTGDRPSILRQVKAFYPDIRIMAVTMADCCEYFFEVPRPGASSYIISAGSPAEFLAALRKPAHRTAPSPRHTAGEFLTDYGRQARDRHGGNGQAHLTGREKQVLELVADGHANTAIADRLSMKPSTVRTHRANIVAKLGLPSRTDLVKYALAHGFVSLWSTE